MKKIISIVLPVYNEKANLALIEEQLVAALDTLRYKYEIIFVDDGSTDESWDFITSMSKKNKNIKGLKLTKNYGHQIALKAGIDHSTGDALITMDSDLQHPPALISALVLKWEEGFDVVNALRTETGGVSFLKKITSSLYYKILYFISGVKLEKGTSDFRLIDKKVAQLVSQSAEQQLFLRGYISSLGFSSSSIKYAAQERREGNSKFTFKKMFILAIDGIMSFSNRPLRLSLYAGLFISFSAFLYIIYSLYVYFILNRTVHGWSSLIISILFLGGIQLSSVGLLGEYIGRIYIEIKGRPQYLISDHCGNNRSALD